MKIIGPTALLASCVLLAAMPAWSASTGEGEKAYASTYWPLPSKPTAIVGATILTAAGPRIDNGTILFRDGKVVAAGPGLATPAGFEVIDGKGKWVTPGVIDPHVHLGVSIEPNNLSVGEMAEANSAEFWVEQGLWPQDPAFADALAAGVTTMLVLPGSGNLFGGRGVTIHPVPAVSAAAMKVPDAPQTLKMACGENPVRVFGEKGQLPTSIAGTVAGYRAGWIAARDYDREWSVYEKAVREGKAATAPKQDIKLDTLRGALNGKIPIQMHCYRADEMVAAIQVAHEFGFRIAAFHHATEAYKIAPLLRKEGICAAVWAQTGPAKMEMLDVIPENAAMLETAGACVGLHSDGPVFGEHLPLEAAIAMAAGRSAGLDITPEEAVRWFTLRPAQMMGIAGSRGSLEPDKAADIVLWNRDPFSVYALPERVFIDGALVFDRSKGPIEDIGDLAIGRKLPETK